MLILSLLKMPIKSEFIAECFMRRAYISGFTGSVGTAVVTKDKAALWTDGRYFLQVDAGKDEVLANGALKHEEKDIKEPEEENASEGEFIKVENEALDVKDCPHTNEATRDLEIKPSVKHFTGK
ncbi:hypothetical protein IFM89_006649 [Coptis chinensis]|uniref:Creatinase N-terminal domain-containing protein n=1 Tax=Coptis chinensis TaxID=261450 RepID=A0A835IWG2_9MAGN|nr:hypothetical protein IFM89_006649 [Coptis chinensis]